MKKITIFFSYFFLEYFGFFSLDVFFDPNLWFYEQIEHYLS